MIRLRAHAKINLALRVGPLGDDGYHPLATVFQTVSLADLLYAEPGDAGRAGGAAGSSSPGDPDDGAAISLSQRDLLQLGVEGAALPPDNTIAGAVESLARLLQDQGRAELPPVRMRLVKRIPIGAGLGGGSSDAAAAIRACLRLWGVGREGPAPAVGADALGRLTEGVGDDALARIGRSVGADVPFFFTGGTALGTGRGSEIEPLPDLRPRWIVLAASGVAVSTTAAYGWFDEMAGAGPNASLPKSQPEVPTYQAELAESWMGNELAAAVAANCPEVEETRRALVEIGASVAQMTGSGSACFGVFAERRSAVRAAGRLRADGLWARACTTIDRRQHLRTHL